MRAEASTAPLQSQGGFMALVKLGVGVSWEGRRVTAPPGVLDKNRSVDLTTAIKKREEAWQHAHSRCGTIYGG